MLLKLQKLNLELPYHLIRQNFESGYLGLNDFRKKMK